MKFLQNRYRFVIIFIAFWCLTSICSNYIIINFTFICMDQDFSDPLITSNGTVSRYDYDSNEKSAILWAVAAGTITGTFPLSFLYTKYGARYPFLVCGVLSLLATAAIPSAAHIGLNSLLVVRFCQGLGYAADFPAIGLICVRWAPLRETSFFISILTAFTPIASSVTNAVSGLICDTLGWKWTFYIHALFSVIIFTLWAIFYSDDPKTCSRVSEHELRIIQKGKTQAHCNPTNTAPYKKMLVHPVMIVVWLNAFVEMSSAILYSTYSPIYFHKVLGFTVQLTGYILSLAFFVQLPFKFTAGYISDRTRIMSEKKKMLLFNSIAVGLCGLVFCVVGFVPSSMSVLSVVLFASINCTSSMNCAGFYKCGTLVARQHSHFVIATIQFMKCMGLFSAPALVNFVVTDEDSQSQWAIVFLITGILLLIVNFISYPIFTDEPADFTKDEETKEAVEVQLTSRNES